jgi:hypothetical protein
MMKGWIYKCWTLFFVVVSMRSYHPLEPITFRNFCNSKFDWVDSAVLL